MHNLNKDKYGFAAIEIVLVVLLIALIGFVGYFVVKHIDAKPLIKPSISHSSNIPNPVTYSDNNKYYNVVKGQSFSIQLNSTYWQFNSPQNSSVVQLAGAISVVSTEFQNHCVAGQGCGSVTQLYKAIKKGQTSLTANRNSCGEAMACTGNSGSYKIVINVN